MLATRINSTESYTKVMDFKIFPEPRNGQNMFQKKFQALFLPDQLLMHLNLYELAYSFEIQDYQCCM